ncbi:MAG: BamA/TamA family outer membrane protein [Bacteroidota bacterium]
MKPSSTHNRLPILLLFLLFVISGGQGRAQLDSSLQKPPRDSSLSESTTEGLPILMYDTDVGFGYGAKGFFLNQLGLDESFDILLFNSTKGERYYRFVASLPDFERRQGKVYPLAVDLIVEYDKWIKNNFFGVGNTSNFNDREYYTREPLDISLALSRGFTSSLVGQVGWRYKTVRNFNFSEESRLQSLPPALNASRAVYTSVSFSLRYDTRNSYINPSQGSVLQGDAEFVPHSGLENVTFTRLSAWAQHYTELFIPKTVLALRVGVQGLMGSDLPVQVLMPIGGSTTLRGSPQDRYLDKVAAVANTEVRFPIFWRFGGVAGFDFGKVWSELKDFDFHRWAVNPAAGLRFYMNTFVVRCDVGFGKETTGLYFNFGHVF